MAERPIKKSERQVSAEAGSAAPNRVEDDQKQVLGADTQSREKRGPSQQDQKGRGRKGNRQKTKEEPSRANPALLRGPKPTKPKPPIVQDEQTNPAESPAVDEQTASTESQTDHF